MEQSAAYLVYQNEYSADKDLLLSNTEFKTFESLPTRRLVSLNSPDQTIK